MSLRREPSMEESQMKLLMLLVGAALVSANSGLTAQERKEPARARIEDMRWLVA